MADSCIENTGGRPRKWFRNQRITCEFEGHKVVMVDREDPRRVLDEIIGIHDCRQKEMDILLSWERYFFSVGVPFITTFDGKKYRIWKIRRA